MVTLGCLHAHHSNIAYVDQVLAPYDVSRIHFVDPGLMRRITHDPDFAGEQALTRVRQQLAWMAACVRPSATPRDQARHGRAISSCRRGAPGIQVSKSAGRSCHTPSA